MADGREVGVFTGHLEGITYVDSKGDGRYVLSNGKDQTMKLWDIRYNSLPPIRFLGAGSLGARMMLCKAQVGPYCAVDLYLPVRAKLCTISIPICSSKHHFCRTSLA